MNVLICGSSCEVDESNERKSLAVAYYMENVYPCVSTTVDSLFLFLIWHMCDCCNVLIVDVDELADYCHIPRVEMPDVIQTLTLFGGIAFDEDESMFSLLEPEEWAMPCGMCDE